MAKKEEKKKPFDKQKRDGQQKKEETAKSVQKKEFAAIVRIGGVDVPVNLTIERALSNIRGFGNRMARIVGEYAIKEMNISDEMHVGDLSESQIDQLDRIIANPMAAGIPEWMCNKRGDFETGATKHIVSADLVFDTRQMIEREKAMRSYRGIRHLYGQKARGQHTRSTGRTGRTVGVLRIKAVPGKVAPGAAAGAPGAAGKEEKVSKLSKAATKGAAPAAGAPAAKAAPVAGKPEKKEEKK